MSGRSEDNSRFDTGGREYLTRRSDGERIGAEPAYKELLANESVSTVAGDRRGDSGELGPELLRAARGDRGADNPVLVLDALARLRGKLLRHLCVLRRVPAAREPLDGRTSQGLGDEYVECISTRGLPQPLISRFTGEPVSVMHRADLGGGGRHFNPYYPSPEMHADAFDALEEACRDTLSDRVKAGAMEAHSQALNPLDEVPPVALFGGLSQEAWRWLHLEGPERLSIPREVSPRSHR